MSRPTREHAESFITAVGHLTDADSAQFSWEVFIGTRVMAYDVLVALLDGVDIVEIENRWPALSLDALDAIEDWRIRNLGSAHERMAMAAIDAKMDALIELLCHEPTAHERLAEAARRGAKSAADKATKSGPKAA